MGGEEGGVAGEGPSGDGDDGSINGVDGGSTTPSGNQKDKRKSPMGYVCEFRFSSVADTMRPPRTPEMLRTSVAFRY